jgi:PAS domain S-box-containing protein
MASVACNSEAHRWHGSCPDTGRMGRHWARQRRSASGARGSGGITDTARAAYEKPAQDVATSRALLALQGQLGDASVPAQCADAALAFLDTLLQPDAAAVYLAPVSRTNADTLQQPVRAFGFPVGLPLPGVPPEASIPAPDALVCSVPLNDVTAVQWGETATACGAFGEAVRAAGFGSWGLVPLPGRGGCLGVVAGYWRASFSLSEAQRLLLEVAGRQVAAALDHLHARVEQRQSDAERAQLAATVELSDDAIIGIAPSGTITRWNAGAHALFGYAAEEVVGQDCLLLSPDSPAGALSTILQRLQQGGCVEQYEMRRLRSDGAEVHIVARASPVIDSQGHVIGAVFVARDITEHRTAKLEHGNLLVRERAAREQLDAILGGVADGVMVQREDGTVLFANEAAARIAGFESVDAYMQGTAAAVSQQLSVLDAEGRPFALDQLPARRAFRGDPSPDMVVQFRRAGTHERRWSRTQSRIVRGPSGEPLAISIFHDITDEMRSHERLRFLAEAGAQLAGSLDVKRTLESLVGVASTTLADWALVLLIDDDGEVQNIASAHRDPAKAALAGDLHERQLIHAQKAKLLWEAIQDRESKVVPVVTDEMLVASARDAEHLALLRALDVSSLLYAPLIHGERVQGAIALFMAGSGRSFGEEDRAIAVEIARRASLALENARLYEETNAAVQARDEFLSIASHELRTPVTAISGIAQVALRSKQRGTLDDARLTRVLDQLIRGSQRLVTLTEDLLDVSRLQTGRFELRREPLDLAAFVSDFVERFGATFGKPHLLILRADAGPLMVQADPARVEQVLSNLLSNAVKYAPDGGEIAVAVSRDGEQAACSVTDQGIGLPPGTAEMIFQPFGRAPNAAHRQIQGLGLGLYICRQIVERHGGTIRAESAGDGSGTAMRVWLPLADEPAG